MSTLHVFNPETDFALAVGEGPYTSPRHVVELKRQMALLPSVYAKNGDFILVPDDYSFEKETNSEYVGNVGSKNLRITRIEGLSEVVDSIDDVFPWGWNHNLKRELLQGGIPESLLPEDSTLQKLKELSHRRTAIKFRKHLAEILELSEYDPGEELFNLEEVKDYLRRYPYSYFKSPWSSSGRGVVSSTHITEKGLLEWTSGSIRRQGSVVAEPGYDRKLDFATEWVCRNGEPHFVGVSIFKTSPRGKYQGNLRGTQEELTAIIDMESANRSQEIIKAQAHAVKTLISPYYDGPLGIDMLSDREGNINPCVEINLRMTMGHIEIFRSTMPGYPSEISNKIFDK